MFCFCNSLNINSKIWEYLYKQSCQWFFFLTVKRKLSLTQFNFKFLINRLLNMINTINYKEGELIYHVFYYNISFKKGENNLQKVGNPGHWGNPYICFYECVVTSHSCKSIIANYYGFYSFYSLINFIYYHTFSLSIEC